MQEEKINCIGKTGRKYEYVSYKIKTSMKDVPANYIFAKLIGNTWHPIYIGETSNLKERLDNHHKQDCILSNGATHILTHKSSYDQKIRLYEEADLRRNYKTSCNEQ